MKRRILIGSLIALAVGVVAVVGYRLLVPPAVPIAEVEERDIVETLVATGHVEPVARTPLMAEVAGRVVEVPVQEGDAVDEGEIVARLDNEEGRLALEQADAVVAEAQAQVDAVVDQGAPTALADLNRALTGLDAAEEEFERAQRLFDEGLVTSAEVDERRRQVEVSRSDVASARAAYREAGVDGSTHDQAAAMLERAVAEREMARLNMRRHRIRAPEDATVLSMQVDSGSAIQPGQVVAVVAPEGPIDIRITPDERELSALRTGQPVHFVSDAFPRRPFEGTVRRIDPIVDPERGTLTAYLQIDDPPRFLRADMTVTAEVELGREADALVVPRVAVRDIERSPWVVGLNNNRATRVDVEVGLEDERFVQIHTGLQANDEVIVDPDVEPGDRVRRGPDYEPVEPVDRPPRPELPEPPGVAQVGEARQ